VANDEQKPVPVSELAARLSQARQDTLDSIAHPVERPVFRTTDDGKVLLRNGATLEGK